MDDCESSPAEDTRSNHGATAAGVYRDLNDQILELARRWGSDAEPVAFRCECGVEGCADVVNLLPDEYIAARDVDAAVVVVPAHREWAQAALVSQIDRRAAIVRRPMAGP